MWAEDSRLRGWGGKSRQGGTASVPGHRASFGAGPPGSHYRPAPPLPRGRAPQVGSDALEPADSIWAGKGKWPSWSGRARGRAPLWSHGASLGRPLCGLPGGVQPVREAGCGRTRAFPGEEKSSRPGADVGKKTICNQPNQTFRGFLWDFPTVPKEMSACIELLGFVLGV